MNISESTEKPIVLNKPKPWIAVIFALINPVLGYLYVSYSRQKLLLFLFPATIYILMRSFLAMNINDYSVYVSYLVVGCLFMITLIIGAFYSAKKFVPNEKQKRFGSIKQRFIIIILLIVQMTIHSPFKPFTSYVNPSFGAYPGILQGDYIAVAKASDYFGWKTSSLKPGDLVLQSARSHPKLFKRVISLAGNTVTINQNTVFINITALDEVYTPDKSMTIPDFILSNPEWTQEKIGNNFYPIVWDANILINKDPVTVTENQVYLLRDNRMFGDSEGEFESSSIHNVVAKAVLVYFSKDPVTGKIRWDRIGKKL